MVDTTDSTALSAMLADDGTILEDDQAHAYIHYSLGLLYGAAVGSILGQPYHGQQRGSFTCTGMDTPPAKRMYSARTALMLATFDSLTSHGVQVDLKDMLDRYAMCLAGGDYTPNLVPPFGAKDLARAFEEHTDADDMDSGALLRVAPCAMFGIDDDQVRAIATLAPADQDTELACVRFVHILRDLMLGNPIRETLTGHGYDRIWERGTDTILTDGATKDILEAALWCLSTTDAYDDCVLTAVNLGGKTAWTAAVAGALAGIVYLFDDELDEGIPADWTSMPGAQWFPQVIAGTANDEGDPEKLMREGDLVREGASGHDDYEKALELYRNAVSIIFNQTTADDPQAVLLVAALHERIGDVHESIAKLPRSAFAKRTWQQETDARDNYATAYQAAGDALKLGLDAQDSREASDIANRASKGVERMNAVLAQR